MDLVSVIIPVYNVEDYLDRCVASVVGQTFQNIEVILVDDGSTDGSAGICDHWSARDSRVKTLHQINQGVSAARNAGLQAASGNWILQVDSDDYIAPDTVERLVSAANETSSDMVICDFLRGSEDNHVFVDEYSKEVELIDPETAISRIYISDHSALRFASPAIKLCKFCLYSGIIYPEGKIFEDIYTTHKLLYRCNQIAVLESPLYYYFQRPNSIMTTEFNIKKLDYLQALVERVEFFSAHDMRELESIAYDELLHSLIWEYSRTRDVLNSEDGMKYVTDLFHQVYQKGYASQRYPKETARFLSAFNKNPEWIILYWKISGKLRRIFKRNG